MATIDDQLDELRVALAIIMEDTDGISKTDDAVNAIREKLNEPANMTSTEAGSATVDTVMTVINSWDKFESGDPALIAIGVLDTLAEVTAFASLAGPHAAIAASVIGPICMIVSAVLSRKADVQPESEEAMIQRVVTEALQVQTSEDLKTSAAGVTHLMTARIRTLNVFQAAPFPLSENDMNVISDDAYLHGGVEFLGKLHDYIRTDVDNMAKAETQATLIKAYVTIAWLRVQMLLQLSALFYAHDETNLAKSAQVQANEQQTNDRMMKRFSFLQHRPNWHNNRVYAKVMQLPPGERGLIEAYIGGFAGKLVRFKARHSGRHLVVTRREDQARSLGAGKYLNFADDSANDREDSLFCLFGMGPSLLGAAVRIFSVGGAGYVYTADYQPITNAVRRVNGWMPGNSVAEGLWSFGIHTTTRPEVSEQGEPYSTWSKIVSKHLIHAPLMLYKHDGRWRSTSWEHFPGHPEPEKQTRWEIQLVY